MIPNLIASLLISPKNQLEYYTSPQEWSTPLLEAISGGKSDCVKLLLDEGADPNIKKKVSFSFLFLS